MSSFTTRAIDFFELATELCDAAMAFVEGHLDMALICPRSAGALGRDVD